MNEQFEHFARMMGGWFWETDSQHRFVYISQNVEAITGEKADWHLGKSRQELYSDRIVDDVWKKHLNTLDAHTPFQDFTFKGMGPNGGLWLSTTGEPFFGEDGEFVGYRGVGRDASRVIEQSSTTDSFKAIFDQLNEAIALWDAKDRFIIGNLASHSLHEGVETFLKPGFPFEKYIREDFANGLFPDAIGNEDA